MTEAKAVLWSDFDGTGVETLKKRDPRNWRKYPVPGIPGYDAFLGGVASTGVDIGGVVSRRKEAIRRRVTHRSIVELGYSSYFPSADNVVLAGSEVAKGRFVVAQSKAAVVGMLEDKPHALGEVMLGALAEASEEVESSHHPIVLGVVNHPKSQEYISRLADFAVLAGLDVTETSEQPADFKIEVGDFALHVVQLEPYTFERGQEFGHHLLGLAA